MGVNLFFPYNWFFTMRTLCFGGWTPVFQRGTAVLEKCNAGKTGEIEKLEKERNVESGTGIAQKMSK